MSGARQTMRSRIEPMKKIARSRPYASTRELILNYFRARKIISRGIVDGLNNSAKVTMRKIIRIPHVPGPRTGPLSLA
jgi:transposase